MLDGRMDGHADGWMGVKYAYLDCCNVQSQKKFNFLVQMKAKLLKISKFKVQAGKLEI